MKISHQVLSKRHLHATVSRFANETRHIHVPPSTHSQSHPAHIITFMSGALRSLGAFGVLASSAARASTRASLAHFHHRGTKKIANVASSSAWFFSKLLNGGASPAAVAQLRESVATTSNRAQSVVSRENSSHFPLGLLRRTRPNAAAAHCPSSKLPAAQKASGRRLLPATPRVEHSLPAGLRHLTNPETNPETPLATMTTHRYTSNSEDGASDTHRRRRGKRTSRRTTAGGKSIGSDLSTIRFDLKSILSQLKVKETHAGEPEGTSCGDKLLKANHHINEDVVIFSFVVFCIFGVALFKNPYSFVISLPVGLVLLDSWTECFKRRGK